LIRYAVWIWREVSAKTIRQICFAISILCFAFLAEAVEDVLGAEGGSPGSETAFMALALAGSFYWLSTAWLIKWADVHEEVDRTQRENRVKKFWLLLSFFLLFPLVHVLDDFKRPDNFGLRLLIVLLPFAAVVVIYQVGSRAMIRWGVSESQLSTRALFKRTVVAMALLAPTVWWIVGREIWLNHRHHQAIQWLQEHDCIQILGSTHEGLLGDTTVVTRVNFYSNVNSSSLAQLERLSRLRSLSLGRQFTDADLVHLEGLASLEQLYLSGTQVTGAGLVHLKGLTNLRILNLQWTPQFTDAGLVHLEGLASLEQLYLSGTQVTGAGLVHLKGLNNLRGLNLSGTQVTDAGLEHLKGLNDLHVLNLSGTQVTDAGLEHLKGFQFLQRLDLSGTQISDAGLEHLKGFQFLRSVDVGGTQVTEEGLAKLKQAIPKLEVRR